MQSLVQDLCCLATGVALQRFQLLNAVDGETAIRIAAWVTGPAIVLQTLCRQGRMTELAWIACGCGLAISSASHLLSWLWFRKSHERQRAVMTGAAVGSSMVLWSFPVVESVFGTIGLQSAVYFGLSNVIAEHMWSYLQFSTAGPAYPESYLHQDGSTYRGQWDGLNKEGVGVYKYKSGALYEGEWKANQKSGRGVYYFASGGLYEGEWLEGNRNGVGVRTFSDGRVQAGRWMDNKLVSSLDIWQCADAVLGATKAAQAARDVHVGGGKLTDAVRHSILQPFLWAFVAATAINLFKIELPPTINSITRMTAAMHRPFALLAAGLTIPIALNRTAAMFSSLFVVGSRLVMGLVLSASAALWSYYYAPELSPFVLPVMICSLAPVSLQVVENAREFRLNEELASTVVCISSVASFVTMFTVAFAFSIVRTQVRHSTLCKHSARIGFASAVIVAVVFLGLALRLWPGGKRRLVLKEFQTRDGAFIDRAGLEETLLQADASIKTTSDERRGPPPPTQAIYERQLTSRLSSKRGKIHSRSLYRSIRLRTASVRASSQARFV